MVNKFPLTTMFLLGHEVYPKLIADCMHLGIKPWKFDVQRMLDICIKEGEGKVK